jgi:acyl-CoA thioester hydrolase
MKPAPERLVLESYPHVCTINTRFTDVDGQRHLNNAAIGVLYEDARARMHMQNPALINTTPNWQMLVAQTTMRYLGEGFFPIDVVVGTAVTHIGRTSHSYGQALFQNGACIGTADIVLVHALNGRPSPMSETYIATLNAFRLRA